ncbi:hypothetical protein B0H13DRAFT_1901497 [Mycena leptocephala]|nr:hypothetical protein B0H13DRAFT_1901497 [Mycena leptocephala]
MAATGKRAGGTITARSERTGRGREWAGASNWAAGVVKKNGKTPGGVDWPQAVRLTVWCERRVGDGAFHGKRRWRWRPRNRSRWFGLSALDDRRPAYDERREKPMAAAGAFRRLVHHGRVLATHHGIVLLQNNVMYHIPRGCPPHLTAMYIFWGDFSGQKRAKPASEIADVVRGPLGHPSWLNRLHFGSSHSGQTASATQTPFITSSSINQVRTQEFPRLSHRQTQSRPKRLLGRLCIIKKT